MIEFATLFLGLTLGVNTVELVVADAVASIELRLDGETLGRLDGEPWQLDCDLGSLEPHRLEAVAYDDRDREIGRVLQWINLPRGAAEANVLVHKPDDDEPWRAQIRWQSVIVDQPESVTVTFDGQTLDVDDPTSFDLPPLDPDRLHFLRAEVDFTDNLTALAEVTFGGVYADEVSTELTAIPVRLDDIKKLPGLDDLQGWIHSGDDTARVVAAEKGPIDLVVVRDASARNTLARFRHRGLGSRRTYIPLKGDQQVSFVWPHVEQPPGATAGFQLFPMSADLGKDRGGLYYLLTYVAAPDYLITEQRLADAVAVAGMTAARRNRRRAVVLLLGEQPIDRSAIRPADVRHYLNSLHVPFFVWSVADSAAASEWGDVIDVSTYDKLGRASQQLNKLLSRQRILWIDGIFLPQRLTLTDQAAGVVPVP